jgi:hypothetical protein
MRTLVLATLIASASAFAEEPAAEYVPAPASEIRGYAEKVFPCKEVRGWKTSRLNHIIPEAELKERNGNYYGWRFEPDAEASTYVDCSDEPFLQNQSLRELALLRNTIYARYGWAGFRKAWLREHFRKQPWYKPDPKFSYKRLSEVDRRNVELIAKAETSLRYADLEKMKEPVLARAGKWWGDLPSYKEEEGNTVHACDLKDYKGKTTVEVEELDTEEKYELTLVWVESFNQAVTVSKDCTYHGDERSQIKEHQDNAPVEPDLDTLSPEDRIELGLISRAMGEFAVDEGQRDQVSRSLDAVLSVSELRQLSLRDLRLLRNTIYARRGRPFKSEVLQEHFARMPWYKPDPAYTDKRLTKTDQRNIKLIVEVENELGGALLDKDFKVANPEKGNAEEPVPLREWA